MRQLRRDERGSLSVEMVVLTPVLVGCILTIAGGARFVEATDQVQATAAIAARAASLEPTAPQAAAAGRAAAGRALADRGQSCVDLDVAVDVDSFQAGGAVRTRVTCRAELSDLVGFGLPGSRTFTARQRRAPRAAPGVLMTERRDDRGSVSIWALLLTSGAFTLLLGLIVDGGHLIDARLEASRVAAQAARLGADQLSAGSVREGGDAVNGEIAAAEARRYLAAADHRGTVGIQGDRVTVTVTGTSPARILSVIGIDSFPVEESETAQGVTEAEVP